MAKKKSKCYSGIGGQAVLEGVMMKNNDRYAVAVRKPDGQIQVEKENYQGVMHENGFKKLPFIRGIFNFLDSMVLGTRVLNYSASFYEEDQDNADKKDVEKKDSTPKDSTRKNSAKKNSAKKDQITNLLVALFSIVLAIAIFIVLPYGISALFEKYIRNASLMAVLEGCIRILVFLVYVWAISAMEDIKRLYQYHGAEHKCINCVEKGRPLTVHDVMRSSRLHRRCGTSFIFFVLIVSIVLFFFIRVDNVVEKVVLRILLMPVVAGISYEIIRLAGRYDNLFTKILSAPGMLIQKLTTREPDEQMVEVAIAAVEAVFDWKSYLKETFGYEVDDSWLDQKPEDADDL